VQIISQNKEMRRNQPASLTTLRRAYKELRMNSDFKFWQEEHKLHSNISFMSILFYTKLPDRPHLDT